MDHSARSPSFLTVINSRPSSATKASPKSPKIMFKPMRSMEVLKSLNMYHPTTDKATSSKKLNFKPLRTAELNLDEFKSSPKVTTTMKNVRKQLWSVNKNSEKTPQIRRGTMMKPAKNRPSVMNRTSVAVPKQSGTKTRLMDDTLPLMDMEQFTVTKIKRTLFPAPLPPIKYNQRKTSQHTVTKLPIVASMAKQMIKPPKIVITPAPAKRVNKSMQTSAIKSKSVNKEEKFDSIHGLLIEINDKLSIIKPVLSDICVKLGMDDPFNGRKPNAPQINNSRVEKSSAPQINNSIVEKSSSPQINNSIVEKSSAPQINNSIVESPQINNSLVEKSSPQTNNSIVEKSSPPTNIIYKKTMDSTIKLKKTWITQFEQIERKLANNSKDSIHLNSSPDDSPVAPSLSELVSSMKKSQSTSNIPEKKVMFKSKETDVMTESICTYNELRNELPKFLSTPLNKSKDMSFMTPSVQGNQNKMISRRIQQQLFRLNDC